MILRFAYAFCATALAASAATSTAWETSGFTDFLKGRLSGLSLTADGILEPGPSLRLRAPLNQPALWSLAATPEGSVYAATGHTGKLFRIAPDGSSSVIWTSDQPEIFALATTAGGQLYAGTSPSGGVYQIGPHPRQIWRCPAKYIWAIQPAPDASLYVATGEPGRIYHLAANGQADLYYDSGQPNLTALALGGNGHLYAGSDPNGLIYDVSGPNRATILFDSTLPEIRALALDSTGNLYAAAMGGAVATRSTSASASSSTAAPAVAASPTVITVTASHENGIPSDSDQSAVRSPADQSASAASSTSASPATSNTAVVEVAGIEKSAIYRIHPDHTVESLRSSKEDNVYDLLLDGDSVLFSTDEHSRIYRLHGRRTTLVAEGGDGEATRLLKTGSSLYAALSNPARVLAFGAPGAHPGFYESQVHDSTSVARWGHLQWHGTGAGLVFRTRTGNAARPDSTWSDWSQPLTDASGSLIASPPARFIQWRAEWPAGSSAQVNTVDIPYLSQNAPPVIHSITVTAVASQTAAKPSTATTSSSSGAYSITVTDTGEAPAATTNTSTTQTVSRLQTPQTQLSWQADDPDGDKLVYSVYFRAEDETEWQLIRSRMFENTLLLDPDVFADGRYFFRVVASDAPSNAAEYAQEAEFVSTPVLIDNTPPVVAVGLPHRNGSALDIDIDASDTTSPLRLCEYSLDAGMWQPIEAVDGITDSPRERFHLHIERLRPGEHLLAFRVYDSANNAGLAKVILR